MANRLIFNSKTDHAQCISCCRLALWSNSTSGKLLLTLAAALASNQAISGNAGFIDGEFDKWAPFFKTVDDAKFPGTGPQKSTGTAAVKNPSALFLPYLEITKTIYPGDAIYAGAIKTSFSYDPSKSGKILSASLTAAVQQINLPGSSSISLVVEQNGQKYYNKITNNSSFSNTGTWSTARLSKLMVSDFDLNPRYGIGASEATGERPDFSIFGAPMKFGVAVGNSTSIGSTEPIFTTHGIDNFSLSLTTGAPPQHIHLAFGEVSPYKMKTSSVFGKDVTYFLPGSMPAKVWSSDEQDLLLGKVASIFSSIGVGNIIFSKQKATNSTSIYFADEMHGSLLGKATEIDQFNRDKTNAAIILTKNDFFSGNEAMDRVARTAAHEIGHTLGLRHVLPGQAEIMDYYENPNETFQNIVSNVREKPIDSGTELYMTHNPVYHLRRYINGETDGDLRDAGISPGSWDLKLFDKAKAQLDFGAADYQLYQVTVLADANSDDSLQTLAYFDSISIRELSQLDFLLPSNTGLSLLASTTSDGPVDITLARISNGELESVISLGLKNSDDLGLYRIDPGSSNFAWLSEVKLVVTAVPEPSSAVLALIGTAIIWSRRKQR